MKKINNILSDATLVSAGFMSAFLLLGNDTGWKIMLSICVTLIAFNTALLIKK